MNILGQSFDAWVTKQINFRQASLKRGSGKNDDEFREAIGENLLTSEK